MQSIKDLKSSWNDTPAYHDFVHKSFCDLVNENEVLKVSRDFVEQNVFGFGERSFWWLWKLILQELPKNPKLLEVGCFKGATLSLWKLLRTDADIYGITPLNTSGGVWESDYEADIKHIHDLSGLDYPHIIKEYSQSKEAIDGAKKHQKYNAVYIDGDHSHDIALSDLTNYTPMIEVGGYLIIDDCNNEMNMPFGYFQGIQEVSTAKLEWLETDIGKEFEFICSVVHISVYQRIK